MRDKILIEGFEESELLELARSNEFQELIFSNTPVVFTAGTSEVMGQFAKSDTTLRIVLSHIDGGGEGILLKLMNVFRSFARDEKIERIEWIVHAVDCPRPNPKLQRILKLKGFIIAHDPVDGLVYYQQEVRFC